MAHTQQPKGISAYILAGGKSSRMGTDKGLLLFHGRPLIERAIEELKPVFEHLVIVSNNPEYNRFGLEVIEDMVKEIGPAGGIHAALNHAKTEKIFVVSCDMPFISSGAVRFILQHSDETQITVPSFEGNAQPLFGLYAASCLFQWNQLIESGMKKLQQLITYFRLLKVEVDDIPLFNKILFMNVNDQDDFTKALQQL